MFYSLILANQIGPIIVIAVHQSLCTITIYQRYLHFFAVSPVAVWIFDCHHTFYHPTTTSITMFWHLDNIRERSWRKSSCSCTHWWCTVKLIKLLSNRTITITMKTTESREKLSLSRKHKRTHMTAQLQHWDGLAYLCKDAPHDERAMRKIAKQRKPKDIFESTGHQCLLFVKRGRRCRYMNDTPHYSQRYKMHHWLQRITLFFYLIRQQHER